MSISLVFFPAISGYVSVLKKIPFFIAALPRMSLTIASLISLNQGLCRSESLSCDQISLSAVYVHITEYNRPYAGSAALNALRKSWVFHSRLLPTSAHVATPHHCFSPHAVLQGANFPHALFHSIRSVFSSDEEFALSTTSENNF